MKKTLSVLAISVFVIVPTLFAQQSLVGHWEGNINIRGQQLIINVDFRSSGDTLTATIDIPQQNARNLPLKAVMFHAPRVFFELPAGPGLAVFDGQLKDSTISGTFTQAGMEGTFLLHAATNLPEVAEEPPEALKPIVGVWNGAINAMGKLLHMSMTFKTKGGALKASIDIPEQNATDIPLTNVRFDAPRLHCELPAGLGVAVFDGTLAGDSLKGPFMQAGITGNFYLVRGKNVPNVEVPEETVPYKKEEVVFNDDSIKLAGTLTIPPTEGRHPAVVMITGSGSQNRDEELFGFKPFKIIADNFTRHGIAVVRYDDRGVGGSTGSTSQSTTADFARDVIAAIHFLQKRPDINPKEIGVCGHSEGGIVGPLAASESPDVAFVICIAGTGIDGKDLLLAQEAAIMRADSASENTIENAVKSSRRMYQLLESGKDTVEIRNELRAAAIEELKGMPEERRKAITNEDEFIQANVDAKLRSLQSPWFKFFLTYNPAIALEKVKCPVLALFGGLDTQVPAKLNEDAMDAALKKGGNRDYTFKVFPTANHLFLSAKTGSPSEYSSLKKEFVPGFLDTMTDWILKRVTIPK